MLEMLVLTMCLNYQTDACKHSSDAYAKQTGIEQVLSEKEKFYNSLYPDLKYIAPFGVFVVSGSYSIDLGHERSLQIDKNRSILGIRWGF